MGVDKNSLGGSMATQYMLEVNLAKIPHSTQLLHLVVLLGLAYGYLLSLALIHRFFCRGKTGDSIRLSQNHHSCIHHVLKLGLISDILHGMGRCFSPTALAWGGSRLELPVFLALIPFTLQVKKPI